MIEFVVDPHENVWPMVPPGASLQETIESAEDVAPGDGQDRRRRRRVVRRGVSRGGARWRTAEGTQG